MCDSCCCASGPVNYHRGAVRGAVEMPKLLYLPLCTLLPYQTAAHLRYNSQACISRVRSWTSLMIYLYREQSPYLISFWMLNYAARGGRWNDPWKTNKPLWLTRHPAEAEELSQGLIQSDVFVFVWIAPMLGVQGTIHSGTHRCWNVLWAHDSLNSAGYSLCWKK